MSLDSALPPEFNASMSYMHQEPSQMRTSVVRSSYNQMNQPMSPPTGVHVSVDGVPFQYQLTEDDLIKVFSRYGSVAHITVLDEGGAAIVQFSLPSDAVRATSALNGKVLNGVHGALRVALFPAVPSNSYADQCRNDEKYASARKFTCRFDVSPDIDSDFHVSKRIIGTKGINMKKIVTLLSSADSAKLRLRGQGSGFLEGPFKQESSDSLHLCVSCRDAESYSIVLREVTMLFERIYEEYAHWCQERGILCRVQGAVVPRDHPPGSYGVGSFPAPPRSLYPPTWTSRGAEYGNTPSPYAVDTAAIDTPPQVGSPKCQLDLGSIERLIEERNEARRVCNFREADRLRDLLKSHGIGVMDEPGARGKGCQVTTWRFGHQKQ